MHTRRPLGRGGTLIWANLGGVKCNIIVQSKIVSMILFWIECFMHLNEDTKGPVSVAPHHLQSSSLLVCCMCCLTLVFTADQ